ncbi:PTR2-domain-containing protein [Neoconidiobolus thromboides FSU 785]|nr:PTR2-domain-containing protein [Neoconidiobolus thromboides FSU 785]
MEKNENNTNTNNTKDLVTIEKALNAGLDNDSDIEDDKFPKAIYFILPNEFGERFCYYGIKNLLNLYLQTAYSYTPSFAKSQVHLFNGLVYLFPLFGAALSDSFLGKYYTIVYLSIVYLIGNALLAVFSINNLVASYTSYPYWTCILPLILIAIGTGGIKPCVSSHGGDQFKPHQTTLMDKFFALFYLSINIGSLIAQYLTPFLKEKVKCFDSSCYFLAFGIPTIVFLISMLVFIFGYRYYRIAPASGEFLPLKAARTAIYAFRGYSKASEEERKSRGHWLNFANDFVDAEFIEETRLLGKVIVMFIPCIFFWVLYDQNGTEWQNQYEHMNHLFLGFVDIPTEASSNINSILIIIIVPLLSYVVYPFLEKKGIKMPVITRMVWGYIFVILAFIVSTILEYVVENNAGSRVVNGNKAVSCVDCLNGTWQLPQWFLLSIGEAMMSPTGVQFAYTQVGKQMKASATSIWLLTTAFGNYIVLGLEFGIGELYGPTRQWIYTALSFVFLVIFIILSKYWFVSKEDEDAAKALREQTDKEIRI